MVTNDASKIYKWSSDKDYNYHYQVLDYEVNAIRVMAEVDFNTSVNDMAEFGQMAQEYHLSGNDMIFRGTYHKIFDQILLKYDEPEFS